MSDIIKHECGIALIRLLKPLEYYRDKYGTALYGLNKLYLLMEKQHNRGQDGAGVATIKLNVPPGSKYISRYRNNSNQPIQHIFERIFNKFKTVEKETPHLMRDTQWLKENISFTGEVLMGHLRYGTHSGNSIESCHPFLRQNNWMTRNLVLAGNFNMTNVDELFDQLVEIGQHPKEKSDTVTVLEKIGHFIDAENQRIFDTYKKDGYNNRQLSEIIGDKLDLQRILSRSTKDFDGGYTIVGLLGHGDAFVLRDPNGIRPAYYYMDEEVVVAASERPAIQTAFNVDYTKVKELKPGHGLVIKKQGTVREVPCSEAREKKSCSFERIYFSRGTDKDIYHERKQLGRLLAPRILEAIDYDLENTVFSFIPNTAEVAFNGLVKGIDEWLNQQKIAKVKELSGKDTSSNDDLHKLMNLLPRVEKIAVKDVKLRTFITEDASRNELVSHVYDVTYGSVVPGKDTLVVLDDSIVRGTTLKQSILANLDRLGPKRILVVSSAPQIRYPDCYGIDMSKLSDFVAFRAAIQLAKSTQRGYIIDEIYRKCLDQQHLHRNKVQNQLKSLYDLFSPQEISDQIAEIVKPAHIFSQVQVMYQEIEDLHKACPNHSGDWYFSGDYPTPGGNKVVNRAFINFVEGRNERAY